MGGDGGSIVKRSELVRVKKGPTKSSNHHELEQSRWQHCALSLEPLVMPAVVCEMGNLMNKQSALEFIMDTKKADNSAHFAFSHIRALRHLFDCATPPKPESDGVLFHCIVTGLPANGRYPFFVMKKCGCVLSGRAFEQIGTSSGACIGCNAQYEGDLEDARVRINPKMEEERDEMRQRMLEARMRAKAEKKKKKKRKKGEAQPVASSVASSSSSSSKMPPPAPPAKRAKKNNGV
jgi:hypothetical protein